MNRRAFLRTGSAGLATGSLILPLMAEQSTPSLPRSPVGIATTSYMTAWRPKDTYEFLEHCHSLGAAGIQSAIHGDLPKIRARAEQLGMYLEAMVPLPRNGDTSVFEQS